MAPQASGLLELDRGAIGGDELVAAAKHAEDDASLTTPTPRHVIIAAIRERYTAPG